MTEFPSDGEGPPIHRLNMLLSTIFGRAKPRAHTSLWLLTPLLLLLCTSCSRSADRESLQPPAAASQSSAVRSAETPKRMTQAELTAHYPSLNINDVCVIDLSCDSPLRCVQGECRFPAAMTGEAGARTPRAHVETADGATITYALELATTPDEQARGLMHREHMQRDFGMLFIFPTEKRQSFWMKNTLLPLDMVFIRKDGVIDSIIERATPRSLTARESRGEAMYVLELIGGETERVGIQAGDRFTFEGLPGDANP